jgi:hypothetical protein
MIDVSRGSLEEQVLRALYEGSASARECAFELSRYEPPGAERVSEIAALLERLAQGAFLEVHVRAGEARYSLRPAGSERLAELVE